MKQSGVITRMGLWYKNWRYVTSTHFSGREWCLSTCALAVKELQLLFCASASTLNVVLWRGQFYWGRATLGALPCLTQAPSSLIGFTFQDLGLGSRMLGSGFRIQGQVFSWVYSFAYPRSAPLLPPRLSAQSAFIVSGRAGSEKGLSRTLKCTWWYMPRGRFPLSIFCSHGASTLSLSSGFRITLEWQNQLAIIRREGDWGGWPSWRKRFKIEMKFTARMLHYYW